MSTVKVWTPETPESPQEILRANFDPRKHTRWEHRPKQKSEAVIDVAAQAAGDPFDWSDLVKAEVLTEGQVTLLSRRAGVNSLLDLGRLLAGKPDDLPRPLAARRDQLQAWAEARKEWPQVVSALAESTATAADGSPRSTSGSDGN